MGSKLGIAIACVLALPLLLAVGLVGVVTALTGSGSGGISCTSGGAATGSVAGYGADQLANAATITTVGQQLQIPEQGWIVAVAVAIQESTLRNLDHGDRDSLGLFQQRPSQGWGSPAQIMDPSYAATQFYQHLQALPGWRRMSLNDAAQTIQRSATPNAYGQHEKSAEAIVAAVSGASCSTTVGTGDCTNISAPTPAALTAINYACGQRGLPYVWGGKCAELLLMQHWAWPAHAENRQVEVKSTAGSYVHFALSTWESQVLVDRTQRCCVRCNAMERAADLPGAAHLVLAGGVAHLDPESAVFEAMLQGWQIQQRARFLKVDTTVKSRMDLVRRFAAYTNQYP